MVGEYPAESQTLHCSDQDAGILLGDNIRTDFTLLLQKLLGFTGKRRNLSGAIRAGCGYNFVYQAVTRDLGKTPGSADLVQRQALSTLKSIQGHAAGCTSAGQAPSTKSKGSQ